MPELSPDEAYRQAQIAEYGAYVANKAIYVAGGLAFVEGDPVPVSHVERGVVNPDDVDKVPTTTKTTKTGNEG